MKRLLLLGGLCSALFVSCNHEKRIFRHYNEYRATHREEFAGDCSESFPSRPEYKPGETITRIDTVIRVDSADCPDPDPVQAAAGKTIKVPCPPCKETTKEVLRVDTVTRPDAAKEEELRLAALRLQSEADAAKKARDDSDKDRDKWKETAKTRFWIIVALAGGAVIAIILKLKGIL